MRKYFKVAVTALSLAACLALVALWVRSRGVHDDLKGGGRSWNVILESDSGRVSINVEPSPLPVADLKWYWVHYQTAGISPDIPHWAYLRVSNSVSIIFPHWFPALLTAMLAAAPWIKWRFSVRTLLVATGVVAAILGVAVATN